MSKWWVISLVSTTSTPWFLACVGWALSWHPIYQIMLMIMGVTHIAMLVVTLSEDVNGSNRSRS